jgi:hypothetical protein
MANGWQRLPGAQRGRQGEHVPAGHQDLAQDPLRDLERPADDHALVRGDAALGGHHVPEFLGGHLLPDGIRVGASQPHDEIGGTAEQPHHAVLRRCLGLEQELDQLVALAGPGGQRGVKTVSDGHRKSPHVGCGESTLGARRPAAIRHLTSREWSLRRGATQAPAIESFD